MHVSVVLPTYDRADVLGDAIRSVLGQTYDDFELVVVDGGSDDATPAVVSSFADDRIRYFRRDEREGVSAARNAGVRRTDSEAVAFIDSDDRWRPEKLQRQVEALQEASENCGVVYTPITKRQGEPRRRGCVSGDVSEAVRSLSVPTYTSTLLVRREAFRDVGGFDEELGCFEDWELCLRLASDWEFECLPTPMVVKGTDTENVSADPDRLARSVEHIFDAYDLPAAARARFLADAGKTYCEAGRLDEGRSHLRNALAVEFRTNAAAAFVLSLAGSTRVFDSGMNAVYAVEQRLANWA